MTSPDISLEVDRMETIGDTWVPLQSATEGFPPVPDQTEVVALHPFDDRSADSDHSPVEPESPLLHDLLSISAQKPGCLLRRSILRPCLPYHLDLQPVEQSIPQIHGSSVSFPLCRKPLWSAHSESAFFCAPAPIRMRAKAIIISVITRISTMGNCK